MGTKDGGVGTLGSVDCVLIGKIPRRVKKGKQRQCNDRILMLKIFLITVVVQ